MTSISHQRTPLDEEPDNSGRLALIGALLAVALIVLGVIRIFAA